MALPDLVKIYAASSGAGVLTLGTAVPGYRGVEAMVSGEVYSYSIQQGADYEVGKGTYLMPGKRFIRSPRYSSNGGATIDLQSNAAVALVATSSDLYELLGLTVPVDTNALAVETARALSVEQFLSTSIGGVAAGVRYYATKALLDADTTQQPGALAYVWNDPTAANNKVYHYTGTAWVVDTAYYDGLAGVVSPLVAQAQSARDDAVQAAQRRDIIPCNAAPKVTDGVTNPNWLILTPKTGYTIATGSEYRFSFTSPVTNTSSIILEVTGLNDGDARQLRTPDNLQQMPPFIVTTGGYIEIKYTLLSGRFTLVSPAVTYASVVEIVQLNADPSFFQCRLPYATILQGSAPTFKLIAPSDRADGDVLLEVDRFNAGDPRLAKYPGGASIGSGAWVSGQTLEFQYEPSTGLFVMQSPLPGGDDGGGLTSYQQIALRGAGQNAAAFAILARMIA